MLQLLKLGGSSRLLDFISYNLSPVILNSALSSQNGKRYCVMMKACSRPFHDGSRTSALSLVRHAGSLVYSGVLYVRIPTLKFDQHSYEVGRS